MLNNTPRFALAASVAAIVIFASVASAEAQLNETFELDYSAGSIIGQVGGADGWEGGSNWTKNGPSTTLNYDIVTRSGGNEVLNVYKPTAASGGDSSVGRQYEDLGSPTYGVQFSLTLNDLSGFSDRNSGDYINIFDLTGSSGDFSNAGSWLVRGGNAGVGGAPLTWRFYDGLENGGGFENARFVDSGISLVSNRTYTFTLNFLGSGDWTATVTDGITSATINDLGFRNSSAYPSRRINFGAVDGGTTGQVSFDVNEINTFETFSPIPEPSTAFTALLLLGTVGLARPRGRR